MAWIIGWDLIIEYAVGNVAVAISWANYFRTLLGSVGIDFPQWLAAPFAASAVSDLGLPPGCLLVMVHHEVPSRPTVLHIDDRFTAVVAPTAAHAVAMLRRGVRGRRRATRWRRLDRGSRL